MATYSVYNIKIDNNLAFTPGPTAGYVLAIDSQGSTYWTAGGAGGSGGSAGSSGTSGSSGSSGVSVSGSSGSSGSSGVSGSSGTSGSSGRNGTNGVSVGFAWTYNSTTNYPADYGNGKFGISGATVSFNSKVSNDTGDNYDASLILNTINSNSVIQLTSMAGVLLYAFDITSNGLTYSLSGNTYYSFSFSPLLVNALQNGTQYIFSFYTPSGSGGSGTSGSSGSSGSSGVNGVSGSTGSSGTSGSSGINGSSPGPQNMQYLTRQLNKSIFDATLTVGNRFAGFGATGSTSSAAVYTTTRTGPVQITFIGSVNNSNDPSTLQIAYGSGTAPVKGATATPVGGATLIGQPVNFQSAATAIPFNLTSVVNLNQGSYWFDIYSTLSSGSGITIQSITFTSIELTAAVGATGSTGATGPAGQPSQRFITTPTTLLTGNEQVYYDLFVLATYSISGYGTSYSIAGNYFYNNALLSIIDEMWLDATLNIDGELTIGT